MKIASREEIERRLGNERTWDTVCSHAVRARTPVDKKREHSLYELRRLALDVIFPPKKREPAPLEARPEDREALRRKILAIILDDAISGEFAEPRLRRAIHGEHLAPLRAQGRREKTALLTDDAGTALSEARSGLDNFYNAVSSRASELGQRRGFNLLMTVLESLGRPYEKIRLGELVLGE